MPARGARAAAKSLSRKAALWYDGIKGSTADEQDTLHRSRQHPRYVRHAYLRGQDNFRARTARAEGSRRGFRGQERAFRSLVRGVLRFRRRAARHRHEQTRPPRGRACRPHGSVLRRALHCGTQGQRVAVGVLRRGIPGPLPLLSHMGRGLFRLPRVVASGASHRPRRTRRSVPAPRQSLSRQRAESRGDSRRRPYDRRVRDVCGADEPARPPDGGQDVGRTRRISRLALLLFGETEQPQRARHTHGRHGICRRFRIQQPSDGRKAADLHPQHRLPRRKRRDNGEPLRRIPRVLALAVFHANRQIQLPRMAGQRGIPHRQQPLGRSATRSPLPKC